MALYTVRSDRQFCEQLDYNLLFRWFLDMSADEPTFDASSFSRNRERLLEHDVAGPVGRAVAPDMRHRRACVPMRWPSPRGLRRRGLRHRAHGTRVARAAVQWGARRPRRFHLGPPRSSLGVPEPRLSVLAAGCDRRARWTADLVARRRAGAGARPRLMASSRTAVVRRLHRHSRVAALGSQLAGSVHDGERGCGARITMSRGCNQWE